MFQAVYKTDDPAHPLSQNRSTEKTLIGEKSVQSDNTCLQPIQEAYHMANRDEATV